MSTQSSPSPGLTVDELVTLLQKLQAQGLGSRQACIPFTPPQTTMGGSPKVNIVSVHAGIDWDSQSVFLKPSESLGKLDVDQKKYGQKMANQLGLLEYSIRKIISSGVFPPEQRLEQIEQVIDICKQKMHSSPNSQDKKLKP